MMGFLYKSLVFIIFAFEIKCGKNDVKKNEERSHDSIAMVFDNNESSSYESAQSNFDESGYIVDSESYYDAVSELSNEEYYDCLDYVESFEDCRETWDENNEHQVLLSEKEQEGISESNHGEIISTDDMNESSELIKRSFLSRLNEVKYLNFWIKKYKSIRDKCTLKEKRRKSRILDRRNPLCSSDF